MLIAGLLPLVPFVLSAALEPRAGTALTGTPDPLKPGWHNFWLPGSFPNIDCHFDQQLPHHRIVRVSSDLAQLAQGDHAESAIHCYKPAQLCTVDISEVQDGLPGPQSKVYLQFQLAYDEFENARGIKGNNVRQLKFHVKTGVTAFIVRGHTSNENVETTVCAASYVTG